MTFPYATAATIGCCFAWALENLYASKKERYEKYKRLMAYCKASRKAAFAGQEGCMKVVIIGGNDCMVCHYQAICKKYACKAKIFTQPKSNLDRLIGNPELIVLFTRPTAHEMVAVAKKKASQKNILLVQSHCGSGAALRNILDSALHGEP